MNKIGHMSTNITGTSFPVLKVTSKTSLKNFSSSRLDLESIEDSIMNASPVLINVSSLAFFSSSERYQGLENSTTALDTNAVSKPL